MKTVQELRHEYLNIKEQMRDLIQRAKSENRDLTDEENAQFMKMHADQEAAERAIEVRTRIEGMESQQAEAGILQAANAPAEDKRSHEERYKDAWGKYIKRGELDAKEMEYLKRGTSTITTETTGLIYGGYTVPETFIPNLERTMVAFGGMIQAARTVPTQNGGTMNWPTNDDTSTSMTWRSEASAVTVQDLAFGRKQYGAYTGSTLVRMSLEFIQDESVDLVGGELLSIIGERMGRGLNTALTAGDGSGKPTGILAASGGATTGKTAASATAITSTEILDLIHSVDPAYRMGPSVALMMSDSTLAAIKKLQLGSADSSPLWVPSMRDGEPGTIWGYRYVINQDFPTIATGVKSMAFGDWSKYIIRRVQSPVIVRLNELYMATLEQGFIGWCRWDGKLLNTSAIKLLVQA